MIKEDAAEEILRGADQPCGACGGKSNAVHVSADYSKDVHSETAQRLGVSRQMAKWMNFGSMWSNDRALNLPSPRVRSKSPLAQSYMELLNRCEVCGGTGRRPRRRHQIARYRLGLEGSPLPSALRTIQFTSLSNQLFGEDDVDDQGRSCRRDLVGAIQDLHTLQWTWVVHTKKRQSRVEKERTLFHTRPKRFQLAPMSKLQGCRQMAEGRLSVGVRYSRLDLPLGFELETGLLEYCASGSGLVKSHFTRS